MIKDTLSKLLFACILLLLLQVPILAAHYVQYLSGYIAANQSQIEKWETLSSDHAVENIEALIERLLSNSDAVVRQDAENKKDLILETKTMRDDMAYLSSANYPQQLIFMLSPDRVGRLKDVLQQFKPGIPLTIQDIIWSTGIAVLLNALLMFVYRGIKHLIE
ncbi:DUF2937 family protein [Alteromonas facilis]|uniref:DUF2937 family protein n=1 Tax=Alteromonas facilis TaxID=2048004 RepID=UPI000C28805B|nr:DUF2937 family protein [Alteromonas facilis]